MLVRTTLIVNFKVLRAVRASVLTEVAVSRHGGRVQQTIVLPVTLGRDREEGKRREAVLLAVIRV